MIMKIFAALAAIAGIIYVVATFGDKIVAWSKNTLDKLGWFCRKRDVEIFETEEVTEEGVVQANEADFEG